MNIRAFYQVGVVCVIALFAPRVGAQSGDALSLFKPTTEQIPLNAPPGPEVIRCRTMHTDLDLLARLRVGDEIALNLFDDASLVGRVDRIERRSERRFTIFGHFEESPHSTFLLVMEELAVVGHVALPLRGLSFRIGHVSNGISYVAQIDPAEDFFCGNGPGFDMPSEDRRGAVDESTSGVLANPPRTGASVGGACGAPPVMDLLVVYSPDAREAAGGTQAMSAVVLAAVAQASTAYENSEIDSRVRLVHQGEVAYEEVGGLLCGEILNDLMDGVGVFAQVHELREDYGADLVSLFLVAPGGGGCGHVAVEEDQAFSLVRWAQASGTLAHETGHNIGCRHDRENACCNGSAGCDCEEGFECCAGDATKKQNFGAFSYSFGWDFFVPPPWGHVKTVMATVLGVPIDHFSNPDVTFMGEPSGVPVGQEDEANNALTITLRAPVVAAFRPTIFETWVDFTYVGPEQGTYDEPYNTLAEGIANLPGGDDTSKPTLWIKPGSTSETPTLSTPMIMKACGGTVTIGQ